MLSRQQIEDTIRIIAENAQKQGLSLEDTRAQQAHFRQQHERRGLVSSYGVKETTMAAINYTGTTTVENLKKRYAKQIDTLGQQSIKAQIILYCIAKCKPCFMPINFPTHYRAVRAGEEILVINDEGDILIVCRNQTNNEIIYVKCNQALKAKLSIYIRDMTASSVREPQLETLLLIYKEVAEHQGYVPNKVALDALEHYAPNNLHTLCLWWCAANDTTDEVNRFSTVDNRCTAFILALENSVRGNNRNRTLTVTTEDGTDEEIIDPKDNDDGAPNKPTCHWGLQNQLALCMQESHDAAHPDNVYIPDLADTIRDWLPEFALLFYANSPLQAQIKASQLALANAAADHKTAESKYVLFFETISREIEIQGLKSFCNKHGNPTSKEDKELVRERFKAIANNLHYVDFPEPTTGNAENLNVEFKIKAEESKEHTESRQRPAPSRTNRSGHHTRIVRDTVDAEFEARPASSSHSTSIDIPSTVQPTILQFARQQATTTYLLDLGFSANMLSDFIRNAREGFCFTNVHVHILAYLVTGIRPMPEHALYRSPREQAIDAIIDDLYRITPLQHSQALDEIRDLNDTQIQALNSLLHKDLNGDLLRAFNGPEFFNTHHKGLLEYLMLYKKPNLTATAAMEIIQGFTTEDVNAFLAERTHIFPL